MNQQAINEILVKVQPYIKQAAKQAGSKTKEYVTLLVALLIGIFGGDMWASWRERKKFEKKLKQAIEKLSAEEQSKIKEIVAKNKADRDTLMKKVKEYLESKGVDTSDFPM